MNAYAVVESGGKQYRVQAGDTLNVELLDAEPGAKVELGRVLACSDGKELKLGRPDVAGCKVIAEVIRHTRGPKLVSFKMKRRKGYSRKKGHRQELTVIKIEAIA